MVALFKRLLAGAAKALDARMNAMVAKDRDMALLRNERSKRSKTVVV